MDIFDRLYRESRDRIISGTNRFEPPMTSGSNRWGAAVTLRPSPDVRQILAAATDNALGLISGNHWPTGHDVSVHLTVRALDPYRDTPDPEALRRYRCALRTAARHAKPATFSATGLTLAGGSVMCRIEPHDTAADDFAARLAAELGDDAAFEADYDRDMWYANLVHFAEPVRNGAALADWVAEHRHLNLGTWTSVDVHLTQWRFNGRQAVPEHLETARLGSAG